MVEETITDDSGDKAEAAKAPDNPPEEDPVRAEYLRTKELNDNLEAEKLRGEKLRAEAALAGKSVMTPTIEKTEEEKKTEGAVEFFKDGSLGDVIRRANEPKKVE